MANPIMNEIVPRTTMMRVPRSLLNRIVNLLTGSERSNSRVLDSFSNAILVADMEDA